MNRRVLLALALAFALVPLGQKVVAHHNMTAIFDFNDRVTLTGTLSKVDWRNPHIYLTLDVKGAGGAMENWQAEGPSPTWFRIRDIGKGDFADRADPDHHAAGRPRRLGLSAELLKKVL
jgi:hypothetical protein